MKFVLFNNGYAADAGVMTLCSSEEERLEATKRAMFVDGDISGHEDEFAEAVRSLEDDGYVTFEGDPSLTWMTAEVVEFTHPNP